MTNVDCSNSSATFCVYILTCISDYTKGFDGPGRPNIEDDAENSIQTMQYGARNDAWSALDDLYVELEYGQRSSDSDAREVVALTKKVTLALSAYLSLAPVADVEQASASLLRR